jgi:hypothetical protein
MGSGFGLLMPKYAGLCKGFGSGFALKPKVTGRLKPSRKVLVRTSKAVSPRLALRWWSLSLRSEVPVPPVSSPQAISLCLFSKGERGYAGL